MTSFKAISKRHLFNYKSSIIVITEQTKSFHNLSAFLQLFCILPLKKIENRDNKTTNKNLCNHFISSFIAHEYIYKILKH